MLRISNKSLFVFFNELKITFDGNKKISVNPIVK